MSYIYEEKKDETWLSPMKSVQVLNYVLSMRPLLYEEGFPVWMLCIFFCFHTASACFSYEFFILRAMNFPIRFSEQRFVWERLTSSHRKFYGRYGDLIEQ